MVEDIAAVVCSCLDTLCDTGTKREITKPISLFWMYDKGEYILTLPKSSHRWGGFIQDSLQSCAFVVFEEKCFIMEAGRGCQHYSRTSKNKAQNKCDPLLESALIINKRIDLPVGLKLMKKGNAKDLKCWDASKLEHWLVNMRLRLRLRHRHHQLCNCDQREQGWCWRGIGTKD
jgi:hypothetical protein